jgi:hypothetical protein
MLFRIEMKLASPIGEDDFAHRWQIDADSNSAALEHARAATGPDWIVLSAERILDDFPQID